MPPEARKFNWLAFIVAMRYDPQIFLRKYSYIRPCFEKFLEVPWVRGEVWKGAKYKISENGPHLDVFECLFKNERDAPYMLACA